MRQYCYLVKFQTGYSERVMAFNESEAIILAQAKQIEKGNKYRHIDKLSIIE